VKALLAAALMVYPLAAGVVIAFAREVDRANDVEAFND